MTGTQGRLAARDDIQFLAWDLARVSGALSEIATTWRRARACRPDLPLALPQRLADTAGELAADARSLAEAGQEKTLCLPPSLAGRISKLREEVAAAHAVTCGPGASGVGDAQLWGSLSAALDRAAARLPVMSSSAA